MDWRRREGGGVVDYGRMRLSRRKISKRSLLLFLLLFRIGVWVDLMGFLSSWAEIICPLAFWLSRAESVILFSVPYGYSAKLLSKRGKSVLLDFPGKKRSSFFCLIFPQLKCRHGFAYPVSDAEKSPPISSSLDTFFRSKQNFRWISLFFTHCHFPGLLSLLVLRAISWGVEPQERGGEKKTGLKGLRAWHTRRKEEKEEKSNLYAEGVVFPR